MANFTKSLELYQKDTKIMAQAMPSTSGDGGGDTEQQPTVELIHGVSDLPDGYGKIFNAATMLFKCCI